MIDLFEPNRLGNTVADSICDTGFCWEWTGSLMTDGYGQKCHGGRYVAAHRLVYEALVGPVPEGLELDHLCGNPSCVNPDHLEPVTHQENMRRGRNRYESMTRKRDHRGRWA
jgi:hypothetical protein